MEKPKLKEKAKIKANKFFEFDGQHIKPGESKIIELPLAKLYSHAEVSLPVKVIVGKFEGPTVFLSAAIHGDEVNGVEVLRRILKHTSLNKLRGTLLVVPVVNIHGFLNRSRYLPDRRDLNRSFPGSEKGSLAGRIAQLFMQKIISRCDFGIDLHTGSNHRENLPQIRANLDCTQTSELAYAFGTPIILDSNIRDGSLRGAMTEENKPVLVFEGGEALRFDEIVIRAAVKGIISVLRKAGSLPNIKKTKKTPDPFVARSSSWKRAEDSGLFRAHVKLGERVKKDDILGYISGPFGDSETEVKASFSGIVIGKSNLPLVNEGEALFHIARFDEAIKVAKSVKEYHQELEPSPDNSSETCYELQ